MSDDDARRQAFLERGRVDRVKGLSPPTTDDLAAWERWLDIEVDAWSPDDALNPARRSSGDPGPVSPRERTALDDALADYIDGGLEEVPVGVAYPATFAAPASTPRVLAEPLARAPSKARRWYQTRLARLFPGRDDDAAQLAEILARGYGRTGFASWRLVPHLKELVADLGHEHGKLFAALEEVASNRAWQARERDRREREVSEWVFPLREPWQPCWRSHWLPEALPPITDRELRFRISRNPRRAARVAERARLLDMLVNDANCLDARVQAALAWKCRDWLIGPPALVALQPLTRARCAAFFHVSENQIRGALDYIARRYPPK